MELMEAITGRRSIRKFRPDAVSEDDLREIVLAGTKAPNASNKQMWKFVAVTKPEVLEQIYQAVSDRVDSVVNACSALNQGEKIARHKSFWLFFHNAPAVICAFVGTYAGALDEALEIINMRFAPPLEISPAQQSIGAALQTICLAIHAKGYGTTWMYGPTLAYREIGELVNVPAPWVLTALLPVGVPAENPAPRPRKPLDEVFTLIK